MKSCGFNWHTTYTQLPASFYSLCNPEQPLSPEMVVLNDQLAQSLHLNFTDFTQQELAALFSGQQLPIGSRPIAQAYCGHQFGHFGMLGDGRAHLLGEHVMPNGRRFDIQWKGSGKTRYSRSGDGKAALEPMLREYIISEAMHHLGIPTTRSLAVVKTGESIARATMQPGAILTRVANSHIRVGTFEYAANCAQPEDLQQLLDYTLERHYPDLLDSKNRALALVQVVMERQIQTLVEWMRVGFIHGVMNTDNILLCAQTLDYGPCAFMDEYDPMTVLSAIDREGRYAYANQPRMMQWNLARFAESLLSLMHENSDDALALAGDIIRQFPILYREQWLQMMRNKLGMMGVYEGDENLILDLLKLMKIKGADYTNTFLKISGNDVPDQPLYASEAFDEWYKRWQGRVWHRGQVPQESLTIMHSSNPVVIPRNHLVDQVLKDVSCGQFQRFDNLMRVLEKPYTSSESTAFYQRLPLPHERIHQTFCGT